MHNRNRFGLVFVLLFFIAFNLNLVHAQALPHSQSYYVPMPDGTQIAIQVYLPDQLASGTRLPTMMQATRYWRAMNNRPEDPEVTAFNQFGYAVVIVDARGSGASTGTRTTEWSQAEINDYATVIDWIVAQSWSNGKVGAWGVSYPGNTAELIATLNHPAVKIIAPLYDDFDPLIHLVQPGGVFNDTFIKEWSKMVKAMDTNDICTVAQVKPEECPIVKMIVSGVAPVSSDVDGKILAQALKDHETNLDVYAAGRDSEFRDSLFGGESLAAVSPYSQRSAIEASKLPMIIWAGWLDAATVEGTLARYRTFNNPQQIVIGPFSHGGLFNVDPFLPADSPITPSMEDQFKQRLVSLDAYLKDGQTPNFKTGITYYTLNSGKWTTTDVFPPKEFAPKVWYLGADNTLVADAPTSSDTFDTYKVDFTASTGLTNRWSTQLSGSDVIYEDRAAEDAKLLSYTTEPLANDMEITGNPELNVYLSSTETDGALFAYLEAVAPDDKVTYITEGMLHLRDRKISTDQPPYTILGAFHSFMQKDALPMTPGEVNQIQFNLFATSVLLHKGDRIRVSLAGADASWFARYPQTGDPVLSVQRNSKFTSQIVLPMANR